MTREVTNWKTWVYMGTKY